VADFVHLHLHTNYSLLDGACEIERLAKSIASRGMTAAAITDHGVMYGVVDFYKAMKAHGIKPIIGCEIYTSFRTMYDHESGIDDKHYHLVLLAKNNTGYKNLMKIVSLGFIQGFYYKPRVDTVLLRRYSDGLIALSACLAGEIPSLLLNNDYDAAKRKALEFQEIFGEGNFYLELQDHGITDQKKVNSDLIKISRETGIPVVATNDVHYIAREDAPVHDALLCIQTGKTINDENRLKFETDEFYLKTAEEMRELFSYIPEALENTIKIADSCNVEFDFNARYLPEYQVPPGYTQDEYLEKLCYEGLKERYPDASPEVRERLNYELEVIKRMGYSSYFLIVWDFINYARRNGIMVGPGRGSAAGSVVAYCLHITNIDPLKYNLLFERFLNPDRVTMPDIDVDFCYERRQEVIDYVVEKYGQDRVAQIVTFGTMAARAAIRDVGRVLGYSYAEVDQIAKMVPMELGMTIENALSLNPELKKLYDENEKVKKLIDIARALEGFPRHASTHAAGVVISKDPLMEHVPLHKIGDSNVATQFPMTTLEELGLLKMDFLGLRTLTVIRDAVNIIKHTRNVTVDLDKLPLDDPKVYELLSQGNTAGVFQLESSGMQNLLRELKPGVFEDIIAIIGLYRPGPLGSGAAEDFIKSKNGLKPIKYLHPALKPILSETYGIILYQEQVMKIAQELAGFTLAQADILRKAMGKKQQDVMAAQRQTFIDGALKNGIDKDTAAKIFDEISYFAGYGFNKAHTAAYAVIAYQTAYLKAHYPVEFMAALLTSVRDNSDKVAYYINECKHMGIKVMPPDINESYEVFTVIDDKIRFGLTAVKNVGQGVAEAIIQERKNRGRYTDIKDFLTRLSGVVNKKVVESLIKSGAMDSWGNHRSTLLSTYEEMMAQIQRETRSMNSEQISLFEMVDEMPTNERPLTEIPEYPKKELLTMEKDMLGIYLSGHPLADYEEQLKAVTNFSSRDMYDEAANIKDNQIVLVGGIINEIKTKATKGNKIMAFMSLEDLTGTMEILVFPNVYEKYIELLKEETLIVVKGRINIKEEETPTIIAEEIHQFKENRLFLIIETEENSKLNLESLKQFIINHPGKTQVVITSDESSYAFLLSEGIDSSENILTLLKEQPGVKNFILCNDLS